MAMKKKLSFADAQLRIFGALLRIMESITTAGSMDFPDAQLRIRG